MAEDKKDKKEVTNSAERSSVHSYSAKVSTHQQVKHTKEKINDLHDRYKNHKKNSSKDELDELPEFEEIEAREKENAKREKAEKKAKGKIDKKKLKRIKEELFAEDNAESFENKNKALQSSQGDVREEVGYFDANGKRLSRDARISKKNEQLMEDVFRYSRQRTKEIVDTRRQIFTIVLTIILMILLIGVITLGVFIYVRQTTRYEEQYIRVSVSMTNKEIFYDTEVTGELIPKDVSPGDRFALNIVASNSNSIAGDTDIDEWLTIYIRFKMTLIVNGVEYEDYIYIEPDTEVWERYDKDVEDTYLNSSTDRTPVVKNDDGYYYCRKVLWPNEKVTVVDWLRFSETKITEVIGGNDAVLRVDIEALEAIPNIIKNREIWTDAPQHWVEYITNEYPDTGVHEEEGESGINIWYIVVFACVAVVLILAIIVVTTRKKKKKKFDIASITRSFDNK